MPDHHTWNTSTPSPETERTRAEPLARWLWIAAAILVGFVATFWSMLSQPHSYRIFGLADSWNLCLPTQAYLDNRVHHGEFPLWNPLAFCGKPFAAGPESEAFNPFNLVRSLLTIHPTPYRTQLSLILLLLAQYQIAGLGMYALARRHRLSRPAALVAVVAFGWGTMFVFYTYVLPHYTLNYACLPWMLFFMDKALFQASPIGRYRHGVAAGLVYGTLLLGGHPVFMVYNTLLLVAYATMTASMPSPIVARSDSNTLNPVSKRLSQATVVTVVALVVGLGLAAAQLAATTQFAALSIRASQVPDPLKAIVLNRHYRLLDVLEHFFVYPQHQLKSDIALSGAGVTLLALCALLHRDRRRVLRYALLFYAISDILIGPPMPIATVLSACVPYGITRTESYFAIPLIGLPLGILAAFGVDAVISGRRSRMAKLAFSLGFIAVGVFALASIRRWTGDIPSTQPAPLVGSGHVYLLYSIVPALMVLAVLAVTWSPSLARFAYLLPLLAFLDTLLWNSVLLSNRLDHPHSVFLPTYNVPMYNAPMAELHQPQRLWAGNSRIANLGVPMLLLRPTIGGYNPMYVARSGRALISPRQESFYVRQVLGNTSATNLRWYQFMKRQFWLSRQVVIGKLPPKGALFPAATTVFLPAPPKDLPVPVVSRYRLGKSGVSPAATKVVLEDERAAARITPVHGTDYRARPTLTLTIPPFRAPRVHSVLCFRYLSQCAGQAQVIARDPVTAQRLFLRQFPIAPTGLRPKLIEVPLPDLRIAFDKTSFVVTPKTPDGTVRLVEAYLLEDQADENALIHIVSRRANSVKLTIDPLPQSRVLTFVDSAYPGWKAYVDKRPVPIYLADDAFKAIILSPGPHSVRFVFSPTRTYLGILVSVSTALLCVVFLAVSYRRSSARRSPRPESTTGGAPR